MPNNNSIYWFLIVSLKFNIINTFYIIVTMGIGLLYSRLFLFANTNDKQIETSKLFYSIIIGQFIVFLYHLFILFIILIGVLNLTCST